MPCCKRTGGVCTVGSPWNWTDRFRGEGVGVEKAFTYGLPAWMTFVARNPNVTPLAFSKFVEATRVKTRADGRFVAVLIDGVDHGATRLWIPLGSTVEKVAQTTFGPREGLTWKISNDGSVVDVITGIPSVHVVVVASRTIEEKMKMPEVREVEPRIALLGAVDPKTKSAIVFRAAVEESETETRDITLFRKRSKPETFIQRKRCRSSEHEGRRCRGRRV